MLLQLTEFVYSRRVQEFSVRWSGYLTTAVPGTDNFFITSDVVSRLLIVCL